jgi:putative flippase GtrA
MEPAKRVPSAANALPARLSSNFPGLVTFAGKFLRFTAVGAISGVLYALATAASIRGWGIDSRSAAVVGWSVALPFNFLAHRRHTFRSRGIFTVDLFRYVIMQMSNILLSVGAMAVAVDLLALHYVFGILAAIVVVPIVTYFVLDNFVFPRQAYRDPDAGQPLNRRS